MTAILSPLFTAATMPVLIAALVIGCGLGALAIWVIRAKHYAGSGDEDSQQIFHQVDQLDAERKQLDNARKRGELDEAEYQSASLFIDRRLLSLSRQLDTSKGMTATIRPLAITLGVGMPLASLGLYLTLGSPQIADRPFASRTVEIAAATSTATKNRTATADALRDAIAASEQTPDDVETWLQLAQAAAAVDDRETEIRALRTALKLTNQDPAVMSMLAEALSRAADGQVTVPARALVKTVLALDPDEPRALFLAGVAHFQDGDYGDAIARWQHLLRISKPDAPWQARVRDNIREAAKLGNIPLSILPPNPDSSALADAATMTPEDRQVMIDAMVKRLETRLLDQPDDLDGWLRLARAYDVLDRPEKALDALVKAATLAPDNLDLQFGVLEQILQNGRTGTDLDRAQTAVKNAEKIAPAHPQTLFFKGHVARVSGDRQTAHIAWTALLSQLPGDSPMAKALSAEIAKLKKGGVTPNQP